MVLLRRVIGDALRARRQSQHRTLREVSTAANVSLGYLSEIERGQKEASSELLSAICAALGAHLSDLLREASDTVALAEQMDSVLASVPGAQPAAVPAARSAATTAVPEPRQLPAADTDEAAVPAHAGAGRSQASDGQRAGAQPAAARATGPSRPAGNRSTVPTRPVAPNRPVVPGRGALPRPAVPGRSVPQRVASAPARGGAPSRVNGGPASGATVRPATGAHQPHRPTTVDGNLSVTVRHDTPLKTTLLATRATRSVPATRDILSVH